MGDQETITRFHVGGMDCAACATKVDNAVSRIDGVLEAQVSVSSELLTLRHRPCVELDQVRRAITRLGYSVRDAAPPETREHRDQIHDRDSGSGPWWRSSRALLIAACGIALLVAYGIGKLAPAVEKPAFFVALAIGLVPVARRAIAAARSGTPFSIEMLMTLAAIGAVAIGATEEAATVVLLFLVGEMLEGVAAGRARASIRSLGDLVPKTALLLDGTQTREVRADSLRPGMQIVIRAGDRVPADGEIVEGESAVSEAPVTGESDPKHKTIGDRLFAGTVNSDGVLKVKVTSEARDNTIARVVRLVEEAQESKAPTQRFIDRFSRYYTPVVLAVAAAIAVLPPLAMGGDWAGWFYKSLAVLLIGCPCALVISTPAAIASALATGARNGLLVKGGGVLEEAGRLQVVAFDKTGTLTEGKPKVTDVVSIGRSEVQVLSFAAALESSSSHPLALAILERARAHPAPIPPAGEARALAGSGVEGKVGGNRVFLGSVKAAAARNPLDDAIRARIESLNGQGKTVSVLMVDDAIAGLIAMRDEPRSDARAGLQALREAGIDILMLTGDNKRTAQAIGELLGIEARGELMPQDKLAIVTELKVQGRIVGKVGDGINDAPALAAADVGIAMGSGTDVALETADAAILHGRVGDVARLIDLSRRTMRNIQQNIAISLGLKAVFLVTTVAGITGLWPAILADTGATVLVTANAMRLLKAGKRSS